jgi:flagellar motor switch protein FliG
MEDKKNQDVEEIVDSLREKRQTQAKPPLAKTAGLEAVVDIGSSLKKYGEAVTPSNEDFLLWR